MVGVTAKYREAMDKPIRDGAYARVEFDVVDPGAAGAIDSRNDNGSVWYSALSGIEFDNIPEQTYASFEPGRWVCNGDQLVPSEDVTIPQGFTSSILSDAGGVYGVQPVVRISFNSLRSFRALTMWFDPTCGDYPAEVHVSGYRDGVLVVELTCVPDGAQCVARPPEYGGFKLVNSLQIAFVASRRPYARARLQRILFGYTHTVDSMGLGGTELAGISCSAESDPLNREIAYQGATVDLIDYAGIYAFDNPDGIWNEIETRIPMRIFFGARVTEGSTWGALYDNYRWREMRSKTWREVHSGGYYDSFLQGSYWLDARPKTSGHSASFTGVSMIDLLDADFKRWPVEGGSLYDLATLVLESVQLPRQSDGSALWHLWEGLKGIHTTAPMEVKPCREILQDIAIAGQCAIFFDRLGALHIGKLPAAAHDFTLDFDACQTSLPDGSAIPELGGVEVLSYSYMPSEDKELYSATHTVSAGEMVEVLFNGPVQNVKVTVDDMVSSAAVFSSAVYVTFPQAGTYQLLVTGCELEESYAAVSIPVEESSPSAEWATLDNTLIVDPELAKACGRWYREYLLKRRTYEIESIGFPEVDIFDNIYMETRFNETLPVTVLSHSVQYNGGFWSDLTVKVDREL